MKEFKIKPIIKSTGLNNKKCSDYDDSCHMIQNPFRCWFGGFRRVGNISGFLDRADGYCPFTHNKN